MNLNELKQRIKNPMVKLSNGFEYEIFENKSLISSNNVISSYGNQFTRTGLAVKLFSILPSIEKFMFMSSVGEIIILIDEELSAEEIENANNELSHFVPAAVYFEIHQIEFDFELLEEQMKIEKQLNDSIEIDFKKQTTVKI